MNRVEYILCRSSPMRDRSNVKGVQPYKQTSLFMQPINNKIYSIKVVSDWLLALISEICYYTNQNAAI